MNLKALELKLKYRFNDSYNNRWITRSGIARRDDMPVSAMRTPSPAKEHAQPYMTVWLRNIDRLLKPLRGKTDQYAFIDAGCGRGIAALYAASQYDFTAVSGFDFEQALIDDAISNRQAAPDFSGVNFFAADACDHILEDRRQIVFMFNPFGAPVMERFIANNIDRLRSHHSVIAYANHRQLAAIRHFDPASIRDIKGYNCSLISF